MGKPRLEARAMTAPTYTAPIVHVPMIVTRVDAQEVHKGTFDEPCSTTVLPIGTVSLVSLAGLRVMIEHALVAEWRVGDQVTLTVTPSEAGR
jgi:hypothetical protein